MNGIKDPRAAAIVELEAALRARVHPRGRREIEAALRSLRAAKNPHDRLERTLPYLQGAAADRVIVTIGLLSPRGRSRTVSTTKSGPR